MGGTVHGVYFTMTYFHQLVINDILHLNFHEPLWFLHFLTPEDVMSQFILIS